MINGVKQVERKKSVLKKRVPPFPLKNNQPFRFGSLSNFFPMNGMIGRPRIYKGALDAKQITAAEQDIVRALLTELKNEFKSMDANALPISKIESAEKLNPVPLSVLPGFYAELEHLRKAQTFKKSGMAKNGIAYSVVDPLGPDIFQRDSELPQEGLNGKILIAAAQNEYEPASFIVKSIHNIPGFLPVVRDLKSKDGKIIPGSAINIRIVRHIISKGRIYSPNVLINDYNLLKDDPLEMKMALRLSFPEGDKYLNVTTSVRDDVRKTLQTAKNFPVRDAEKLLPFTLKDSVIQQFWLTLKTDLAMKPGLYTSQIDLTSNGEKLASIPVKVRILPFCLPEPKTNYDPQREFTTSVYFFDHIASGTTGIKDGAINHVMPLSQSQFKAYLKNLYEHGIRHPTIIMGNWHPQWNPWKKPQRERTFNDAEKLKQNMKERIALLKEAGFPLKPLYLHTGGNIGFREFYDRAKHKKLLKKFIEEGRTFYKKLLGHDQIYHYGLDEAEGERLTKEFDVWEDMRAMGAKVYTTLKAANIPIVADKIDIAVAVHKPAKANAKLMHNNGGQLWVYAQPFAKQASGYAHRKGYGYGVYFADYDGICNYSFNHWGWRTIPWSMYNSAAPNLSYTMPSADGVIDTPGWEGYREGIDDVRYATLLRQKIAEAKNNPDKKQIAARAKRFLDTVNINADEFDSAWTRLRIIDFLLDLTEKK
jgi:hypothetical protein